MRPHAAELDVSSKVFAPLSRREYFRTHPQAQLFVCGLHGGLYNWQLISRQHLTRLPLAQPQYRRGGGPHLNKPLISRRRSDIPTVAGGIFTAELIHAQLYQTAYSAIM